MTTSSCAYGVSPSHPRLLSVESRRRLLGVLHAVEAIMLLPALDALQLLLFLGKLAGGESPVSSLGFVLRLWSRVRGDAVQAWDAARWRFWDTFRLRHDCAPYCKYEARVSRSDPRPATDPRPETLRKLNAETALPQLKVRREFCNRCEYFCVARFFFYV